MEIESKDDNVTWNIRFTRAKLKLQYLCKAKPRKVKEKSYHKREDVIDIVVL